MAKKKRQNRKKHGEVTETSGEFMSEIPESNEGSWSDEKPLSHLESESNEELFEEESTDPIIDPIIDPIEEQMSFTNDHNKEPQNLNELDHQESHDEVFEGDSIGSFLAEHRESRGISLKNISQSTKISLTNLEYLESDQLEALPDRAYVIGYVKSYARALNADQATALILLEETYLSLGATPREQEIVIPQAQNPSQDQSNTPYKLIGSIAVSLIVVIGLVVFFVSREETIKQGLPEEKIEETSAESSEIKPQSLNAESPLQNKVESTPNTPTKEIQSSIKEPLQQIIEKPKVPAIATPILKPIVAKPPQIVKEEIKAKVVQEEPQVIEKSEVKETVEKKKFYPLAGTLYQLDTSMSEERQKELLPSRFRTSSSANNQNIFITAVTGDSWLTYKSDDDQIRKFVLKKGRSLLVRADEARVFLGNLSAVKIFLNNKPLKITSQTGVKSLVFPQENAESYVMPLFIYKENGTVQTSSEYIEQNP